jgi:hypothetical protein
MQASNHLSRDGGDIPRDGLITIRLVPSVPAGFPTG